MSFSAELKTLDLRAGLNCGRCETTMATGSYEHKHAAELTCRINSFITGIIIPTYISPNTRSVAHCYFERVHRKAAI